MTTHPVATVDSLASGFRAGSNSNARLYSFYTGALPQNQRRTGYPDDISIVFADALVDTGLAWGPVPRAPARFRVYARTDTGDVRLPFRFRDYNRDGTLDSLGEFIEVVSPGPLVRIDSLVTWRLQLDPRGPTGLPGIVAPRAGDVYDLKVVRPFNVSDVFVFSTAGETAGPAAARTEPYVVPNPYVGSASFEPARYAISGRGERRMEFRNVPRGCTIRIYTVRGDLVRTLRHDGSLDGYVAWDLRTKDNLDVAPGLYIFHVEAPGVSAYTGKFAVIK